MQCLLNLLILKGKLISKALPKFEAYVQFQIGISIMLALESKSLPFILHSETKLYLGQKDSL